ncbi:hypothetical protein Hanom_Chr01g00001501 [Helianthus anomalus]
MVRMTAVMDEQMMMHLRRLSLRVGSDGAELGEVGGSWGGGVIIGNAEWVDSWESNGYVSPLCFTFL